MVDINGTASDDILEDLNSSDNLYGGAGNDTITVSAIDDSHDLVDPGTGDNLVTFLDGTGSGHVNIFYSGGNDTIEGSASDRCSDTYEFSVIPLDFTRKSLAVRG